MSRPLRIQYPNAWYHVMNRGRCGQAIFESKEDFEQFIDIIKESIELFSLRISAFCLMTNHYHLLVQTPDGNLSRCMRHINGIYTQRFNIKNGLDGPLFRGRYKAILVGEDSYLLQLIRYIHKNPVRAGMAKSCALYKWSSHNGYLSKAKKWDWLHKQIILSMLSKSPEQQRRAYRSFMAENEDSTFIEKMGLKRLPVILGEVEFINAIREKFFEHKQHIEVPESKLLAPDLDDIVSMVCQSYSIDRAQLYVTKRGDFNQARATAIYLLRYLRGEPLVQIGEAFKISSYSTVSSIIERFKARMRNNGKLQRRVEGLKKGLMSQGQT